MKRFIALMIVAILIASMLGVMTASAGVVKFASYSPTAGASKGIKVSITATAASIAITNVTCGGVFNGSRATGWKDSDDGKNKKITASATINVKVSPSAKPGDVGTVTVSYQIGKDDGTETSGTESRSYKVVEKTSTSNSSTDSKPKATKAPGEWDIAEQQVALIGSEGALSVDILKEDPKVPGIVLTTLKEKQAKLTLNFGTYTCTIDGKTLAALPEDADPIDLTMKMEKDEKLSAALGGKDAYQLHFAHEGQLPGKFTYSFRAQNSSPGDTLYLYYYYDKSGVIEGVMSATVDENGYVTFDIYHCSSYFFSAAPIEGATGVNFLVEDEAAEAQKQAQQTYAELEAKLLETQSALEHAEAKLAEAEAKAPEVKEVNPETKDNGMYAASAADPLEKLLGVPYASFIAAALGIALLSSLLTMLVLRVGIFKKKEIRKDGII